MTRPQPIKSCAMLRGDSHRKMNGRATVLDSNLSFGESLKKRKKNNSKENDAQFWLLWLFVCRSRRSGFAGIEEYMLYFVVYANFLFNQSSDWSFKHGPPICCAHNTLQFISHDARCISSIRQSLQISLSVCSLSSFIYCLFFSAWAEYLSVW